MSAKKKKPAPRRPGSAICIRVEPRVIERALGLTDFLTSIRGETALPTDVYREALMRGLVSLEKDRDTAEMADKALEHLKAVLTR